MNLILNPSSLVERKKFYCDKFFRYNFKKYMPIKDAAYSVIIGRRTGISPTKYANVRKDLIMLDKVRNAKDLKSELLEFLPESLFFSRTLCKPEHYFQCAKCIKNPEQCKQNDGQIIVIDMDPENLEKNKNKDFFSLNSFERIRQETTNLYEWLPFSKKKIFFSGRGFHIYILDKDTFAWTRRQRTELAKEITKNMFHHDEWVCTGEYDQIRVPYSLNGISNKRCIPLTKKKLENFDFIRDKKSKW